MSVLKEYRCLAHGNFESAEETPECPYGCDVVERIFLTPVAFRSARTTSIDNTLQGLATSHRLTDMGERAMRRKALQSEQSQQRFVEFCERRYGGHTWGAVPEGGTYNVQTAKVEGSGPGAMAAVQAAGATGGINMAETKPILETFRKPVLVRQDHENLQVNVAHAPVGKVAQA